MTREQLLAWAAERRFDNRVYVGKRTVAEIKAAVRRELA